MASVADLFSRWRAGRRAADKGPFEVLDVRDNPATVAWAAEQNARAEHHEQQWAGATSWFTQMIQQAEPAGMLGLPVKAEKGNREFYFERATGGGSRRLVVNEPDEVGDHPRVLLDESRTPGLGTRNGYPCIVPHVLVPSPSGKRVLCLVDEDGSEFSHLVVVDVDQASVDDRLRYEMPVVFPNPAIGLLWLGDDEFLYIRDPHAAPGDHFSSRYVYRHRVGHDLADDLLVWENPHDHTYLHLVKSGEQRVRITAEVQLSTQAHTWEAEVPVGGEQPWKFGRLPDLSKSRQAAMAVGGDGRRYLVTDRDAPWGRLVCAPVAGEVGHETWTTLIPQTPGVVLRDFRLVMDPADESRLQRVVVRQARRGVDELAVYDVQPETGELAYQRTVSFPGLGVISQWQLAADGQFDVVWSAPNMRPGTHRVNPTTGERTPPTKPVSLPGITTQLVTLTTRNGDHVHVIVSRPATHPAGQYPRPALVSGYGLYSMAYPDAGHTAVKEAYVRSGGVWIDVIAPGGDEYGRLNADDCSGPNQQRTLDAFHTAAAWARKEGVASRVAARGESGGGLRALQVVWDEDGALAANDGQPGLWDAAVADHPATNLVEAVTPPGLGPLWRESYGDPSDPRQLPRLLKVSPYHMMLNRKRSDRPVSTLYVAGDADTRLHPDVYRTVATHQARFPGSTAVLRVARNGHLYPPVGADDAAQKGGQLAFVAYHLGLPIPAPRAVGDSPRMSERATNIVARTGMGPAGVQRGRVTPRTAPPCDASPGINSRHASRSSRGPELSGPP